METHIEALEPNMEKVTELMGMLSQPARLRLLCRLLGGERSVSDLASLTHISQPSSSHHLKKLRNAGLVESRRVGQTIFYALKGNEVKAILETLNGIYKP